MKTILMAAAAMCAVVATSAPAAVVTFEDQTTGIKPNNYTIGGITFSDTLGANLQVGDFGTQGVGRSLAVFDDDASFLQMDFSSTADSLSLTFGNDDPSFSSAGDVALLRIFFAGAQVGQALVGLNRDDIANQTIGISGVNFDRATFGYANSGLTPINLIEIIGDVTYTNAITPAVPEPATWAMMFVGFGMIGATARYRRRATKVTYA